MGKPTTEGDDDLKEHGWAAEWSTVLVMGGRKDKIRPGDVLGAISNVDVGIQGAQVGKIEVMDKLTWVAVRSDVAAKAAEGLVLATVVPLQVIKRICGRSFRLTNEISKIFILSTKCDRMHHVMLRFMRKALPRVFSLNRIDNL